MEEDREEIYEETWWEVEREEIRRRQGGDRDE